MFDYHIQVINQSYRHVSFILNVHNHNRAIPLGKIGLGGSDAIIKAELKRNVITYDSTVITYDNAVE